METESSSKETGNLRFKKFLWILLPVVFVVYLAWSSTRSGEIGVNETQFTKQGEKVWVSGMVTNRLRNPVEHVEIQVEFFSSSHEKVGESKARVEGIPARGSVPFHTAAQQIPFAAHFRVSVANYRNPYGN
ncbi:MAG TPA: FxLYD domain-containing protein [bacterium]|nr:FxLYD domain-containing protein [bacterium]